MAMTTTLLVFAAVLFPAVFGQPDDERMCLPVISKEVSVRLKADMISTDVCEGLTTNSPIITKAVDAIFVPGTTIPENCTTEIELPDRRDCEVKRRRGRNAEGMELKKLEFDVMLSCDPDPCIECTSTDEGDREALQREIDAFNALFANLQDIRDTIEDQTFECDGDTIEIDRARCEQDLKGTCTVEDRSRSLRIGGRGRIRKCGKYIYVENA